MKRKMEGCTKFLSDLHNFIVRDPQFQPGYEVEG